MQEGKNMGLCTMKELIDKAHDEKYAVPAFNVCNLETIQGILECAEELHAPVILQAHWLEAYYSSPKTVVAMIRLVAEGKNVQYAIHLDHGATYEDTVRCVQGGFTSVMYDGSQLPLDENIQNLKKVCEMAKAVGVTVEGEIGTIGQTSEMGEALERVYLTDPQEAARLSKETGIDCLAVAIGNAHGFYKQEPKLDFERLAEIAAVVEVPLVLHGGTGIPCDQIQKAITMGISKINFSSVLRRAFLSSVGEFLKNEPDTIEFMDTMRKGKEALKEAAKNAMEMCMCCDRC